MNLKLTGITIFGSLIGWFIAVLFVIPFYFLIGRSDFIIPYLIVSPILTVFGTACISGYLNKKGK